MRRADRLFQILQILRRAQTPVTGAALAAELEVSVRTVYRDVADLVAQRVPITGEAGFGYLLSAEYDMPPLMLTHVELEAIALGAQWVAERGDPLLSPAAIDVLAKVAAAVPSHLKTVIAEPSTAAEPRLGEIVEVIDIGQLRDAIRHRTKLRLTYHAEGVSERNAQYGRSSWATPTQGAFSSRGASTEGAFDTFALIGLQRWSESISAFRRHATH